MPHNVSTDQVYAFDIKSAKSAPVQTPESQDFGAEQEELMRSAAQELGENLTDFILRSACAEAEQTLADQRRFSLDADSGTRLLRHWIVRLSRDHGCASCSLNRASSNASVRRSTFVPPVLH